MKSWEPEEIFEEADFPRDKSEKKPKNGKPVPAKKPAANEIRGDVKKPAPAPAQKPPPAGGGVKELKTGGKFGSGGWQPEKIDPTSSKVFRSKANQPASPPPASAAPDPAAAPAGKKVNDFSQRLLQESVLASTHNTVHLLRRWYWEKWPPAGGTKTAFDSIAPHDRIQIILTSLGPKITTFFFGMMGPKERVQFNDIVKRPPRFREGQVRFVREEFMRLLRENV